MEQIPDSSILSVRVPIELRQELELLAAATGRNKSFLIIAALKEYLQREVWQVRAIRKGLTVADQGNFASDQEVKKRFARWGVDVAT